MLYPCMRLLRGLGWCITMPSRKRYALRGLAALQGARAAEALSDASPGRKRKADGSAEPFTSRRPRLTECSEVRTASCNLLLQCHASSTPFTSVPGRALDAVSW